jgi:hypothetical protein
LDFYRKYFEVPFLEETHEYYSRESSEYKQKNGVSAYLIKVEIRLQQEKDKAIKSLNPSSFEKVNINLF